MLAVVRTAQALNLVVVSKGYRRSHDDREMSTVEPCEELTRLFTELGEVRLERVLPDQVILRRNRRVRRVQGHEFGEQPTGSAGREIGASKSDETRRMTSAMKRINKAIQRRKIGLYVRNEEFKAVAIKMANKRKKRWLAFQADEGDYLGLNLNNVYLKRIFSHSSMKKGGRMYGNFAQQLPKEYRVHVTIDYLPTIEIDYSGLHPSMAYHLEGLDPPSSDPYDIGIWETPEQRVVMRPVIKKFFNAMLNDESGVATLSRADLKIIGISAPELRRRIIAAHPAISHRFDSGFGIRLQYEDSCLAEKILLRLLDKGIFCIPIHDSFIVQIIHAEALRQVMLTVYAERFGRSITLSERHLYQTDHEGRRLFPPQFLLPFRDNEVDQPALYRLMSESRHNRFLAGARQG
jgi:hypothetical protein